ncbi:MAG: hypothetical protein U0637_02940 [Phycisphaerales bacterium]
MKTTATLVASAAFALAAGSASAAHYAWDWNSATPNPNVTTQSGGGTFRSLHTEFDSTTNNYQISVVFANRITNGLTIRVGDGTSNPNNRGEQAIIYFDASSLASPKLTAYAYNGQSWATSYDDGNGSAWGSPAGDMIHSRNDLSWINSASAADTAGNTRTYTLNINASTINGHTPVYPGPNGAGAWDGVRFASNIGLWINSFDTVGSSYGSSGQLNCWNTGCNDGLFAACDGSNFVVVPLPPAAYAGLAGLGLAGLAVRRRNVRARQE